MSFNTFGKIFRFTTWGESHGSAIGCIVDGCPPNIPLSVKDIQIDMDRRRPGKSKFTSQRKESDKIELLSGVFQGRTTGTPISMIIYNHDAKERMELLNKMEFTEAKCLPEKFDSNVSTFVCGDEVVLTSWAPPIISTQIINKTLAESYKNYFEILWREAK